MLTLSRRTDYALVALAALADQPGECVSSTRLAETMHVSGDFLRNILKDLARTELVHAERGPQGGYSFVRDPSSIDLLMVVEAIEGPVAVVRCCSPEETEDDGCTHSPRCQIQHAMRKMHEGVLGVLRRMSVADLIAGPDDVQAVPLSVLGQVSEGAATPVIRTREVAAAGQAHISHTNAGEVQ